MANVVQLFDFHLKHKGNKFISMLREPLLSWCPGPLSHVEPGALFRLGGPGANCPSCPPLWVGLHLRSYVFLCMTKQNMWRLVLYLHLKYRNKWRSQLKAWLSQLFTNFRFKKETLLVPLWWYDTGLFYVLLVPLKQLICLLIKIGDNNNKY